MAKESEEEKCIQSEKDGEREWQRMRERDKMERIRQYERKKIKMGQKRD